MDSLILGFLNLLGELIKVCPDIINSFRAAFGPEETTDPVAQKIREIFSEDQLDDFIKKHRKP